MAVAELPSAINLVTNNSISQLEYIAEGYRYATRSEIEDGKLTVVLRKIDEHEDVSIISTQAIIPEPFVETYKRALAFAIHMMMAYEHRKDDE